MEKQKVVVTDNTNAFLVNSLHSGVFHPICYSGTGRGTGFSFHDGNRASALYG